MASELILYFKVTASNALSIFDSTSSTDFYLID